MIEKSDAPVQGTLEDSYLHHGVTHSSMFQYDSLLVRAQRDFSDFQEWTEANPERIAEHFDLYEQNIVELNEESTLRNRLARLFAQKPSGDKKAQEYADYFGITNLGYLPSDAQIAAVRSWRDVAEIETLPAHFNSPEDAARYFIDLIPGTIPEDLIKQVGERLQRLYRILPEFVIQNNGMEKVIRTMMGVVALAAAEAAELPEDERDDRIQGAVLPAYFYAATYPIVDDILQDSDYIQNDKDKSRYHNAITNGLTTGEDISPSELPDHPIAEEMLGIYNELRELLPFKEYRDTYYALDAMYRAQHDDANQSYSELAKEVDLYAPIMIKASLSRIVAHMITGHAIGPERSARMLKTLLRQQLADDQRDIVEDLREQRLTPFTLHVNHPELGFGNPLFYRIAQEAYIWHEVYPPEDSSRIKHTLSKYGAYDMAYTLSTDSEHAQHIREYFSDKGGPVDRLIRVASGLSKRALASTSLLTPDKQLAKSLSKAIPERDPQSMDPRTYISDALSYVNEILFEELSGDSALEEVMRYAIEAGGKRVRPALTLMLAESLKVPRESLEPLLISSEFTHTASLIFDDLPAQDNATLRRGRETAHIKFPEYDAQLAGISMIAHGIGVLGRLDAHFPAERVNKVVEYMGTVLGAKKLCLGQHMDLSPGRYGTNEEIIQMYSLKTSTMIEGALVPLMMLTGRPSAEINAMQQYAYHTGIIFQLRDDILDATSSAEVMGKNNEQDASKQNIVTTLGIEEAQAVLDTHLRSAAGSLTNLPFPTDILRELTVYFATRNK